MKKIKKQILTFDDNQINKKITQTLKKIQEILPIDYNQTTLLEYFKKYYPLEWNTIVNHTFYKCKELASPSQKAISAEQYFFSHPKVKHMLAPGTKAKHQTYYNNNNTIINEKFKVFHQKRMQIIQNYQTKIENQKKFRQMIEPYYADAYISIYKKKETTLEQKTEIVKELSNFNCKKVIDFLQFVNATERNNSIKRLAFNALQQLGEYVRLKKQSDDNTMSTEIYSPLTLVEKIKKDSIQSIKKYDVFISHRFSNLDEVIVLYNILNKRGYSCYCDWSCDTTFLIRDLANEYTAEILKIRIEQSSVVVFLDNKTSSSWVNLELEHAKKLNKKIFNLEYDANDKKYISNIEKLIQNLKNNNI